MNELKQFLAEAKIRQPKKGMVGVQTGWMPLAEFTLKGGKFLVCDFNFIPSEPDGVIIRAKPGEYTIEAKAIDFDGDRRISRLRIFQRDKQPILGKKIGETWTDTAMTGVCDLDNFTKEWSALEPGKAEEKLQEEYEKGDDCGVFRLQTTGTKIPFVSSGFGDGRFPVFKLRDRKVPVGFEIEFIAEAEPFPFGENTEKPKVLPPLTEEEREAFKKVDWNKVEEMFRSFQKPKK